MDRVSLFTLFTSLIALLFLSAFFSASETAMMALNRYRLNNLAENGHKGAKKCLELLEHTDRLLGTILLGNNLVNNAAAALATVIALKMVGEVAIAFATGAITLIVLILAEIPPKTVAALYPERIAFRAVYILAAFQWITYPIVTLVNHLGSFLPRLFGIIIKKRDDALSPDEIRSVVKQSTHLLPDTHQDMLLRILELENITVEDIMIPRATIEAINLDDEWDDILEQLATSHHTLIPVYRGSLDNIVGEVHLRNVLHQYQEGSLTLDDFLEVIREPIFIPEGTKLTEQLIVLKEKRRKSALVIDEYGDIRGLVTLDEVLEEIVGEFTIQIPGVSQDVYEEESGSYLVDAKANIRDLNRKMNWHLPVNGPKTLNGLILEELQDLPNAGTTIKIDSIIIEIVKTNSAGVDVVRMTKLSEQPLV